jgi:lysophospholipase L1-like esterase
MLCMRVVHAGEFFIRDGDRVVFLGDSITEQRLYTTYIEAYALSRFPNWKLSFRNAGWGGDTAWLRMRLGTDEVQLFAADDGKQTELVKRSVTFGLQRDVLPLEPTVVLVKFGMNDHYYQAFRPDILRAYVRAQTETARLLAAAGARVAFLTPQPIEEKRVDPDQDVRNLALRKFSDALSDVAARVDALFIDQFDPYMAVMKASSASTIGRGDAIHPGPAGQTLMAWIILKGLGATPLFQQYILVT